MGAETTDPSLSPAKVIDDRRDRPRGAALASSLPLPIRALEPSGVDGSTLGLLDGSPHARECQRQSIG
jgi:hypothetical protein